MNVLYQEIGGRIQELRRLHHLTQEDLAEKLDVSVKHISSVERGTSSLSLEKLIQVSVLLDCTIDYLVLGRSITGSGEYIPKSILEVFTRSDQEECKLLQEYLLFFNKLLHLHPCLYPRSQASASWVQALCRTVLCRMLPGGERLRITLLLLALPLTLLSDVTDF